LLISSLLPPLFVDFFLCLLSSAHHRDLHSFPTRRSSDLLSKEAIRERLDAVEFLLARPAERTAVRASLERVHDIERLLARCSLRSEEHTSEPSHEWISYAVFCLKKKNEQRRSEMNYKLPT